MSGTGKLLNTTGDVAQSAVEEFMQLMKDFNVIGFVLGLLFANGVAEIANSFIDGVLMPTIQPSIDKLSKKGSAIQIGSVTLHLEKFFQSVSKFIMIALIIFILMRLGVAMNKPVNWVRIVGNAEDLDLY